MAKPCDKKRRTDEVRPCLTCGSEVRTRPRRRQRKYCSRVCKSKAQATRNSARAKRYTCLNCGASFQRKRYASGSISCQKKYCSRHCAFEARRLKKDCAKRPLSDLAIARRLSSWFSLWGDDVWPIVSPCVDCGAPVLRNRQSSPAKEKCYACETSRVCIDCGVKVHKYRKRCDECTAKATKDARRKRKQVHGNANTTRKRCRLAGAPYSPVSRKMILDRDGWTCQLCGVDLLFRYTRIEAGGVDPRSPTIDHIIPLARGPEGPGHVESNCQAACWRCNTEKSDLDPHSFVPQKATDLQFKAWQRVQHHSRSTSSKCEAAKRLPTARSLAPR